MNFEILELKKDNIENTTSNNIRVSKIVINKFYCSGCETYFKVIRDHLIKYHKPKQDPRNKGNIKCDLCDVYVKDYYSHTFSKLHRFNLDINSIDYMCDVDDFLKHFDKYIKDPKEIEKIISGDMDHCFWITAYEQLDKEQIKTLKEEIIGRERKPDIRKKRRNSKHRDTGRRGSSSLVKSI